MSDTVSLRTRTLFFAVCYLGLILLYVYVAYTNPGYDDEFHSIRAIERFGFDVVQIVAQRDIHPGGSYFLDWVLFEILGDWNRVRVAIALFAVGTVIYSIQHVRFHNGPRAGLLALLLLGLNPALLMWLTGVRWYAFFVPVLLLLTFPPRTRDVRYWGFFFGGLLALGYLSYAMFVVALPLFYLYWRADSRPNRVKLRHIAFTGGIFLVLYAYQLWVFFSEHFARSGSQLSSLIDGVLGFAVSSLSNQGVFPLSLPGIASALGTMGIFAVIALTALRDNLTKSALFVPYWLGVLILVISGLGGKVRNFVVLAPWQALFISTASISKRWRKVFLTCVGLVMVGNIAGLVNVTSHSQTSKSSWNLPVSEVVQAVDEENQRCGEDILVVAHDPTLTYLLESRGYDVISNWATKTVQAEATSRLPRCVVALKTYSGSRQFAADRIHGAVAEISAESSSTIFFGYDPNYRSKRVLEPDFPEYLVEMTTLRGPIDLTPLQQLDQPQNYSVPATAVPTN